LLYASPGWESRFEDLLAGITVEKAPHRTSVSWTLDSESGSRVLDGSSFPFSDGSGARVFVLEDTTERRRRLETLIENERRFRSIALTSREMVTETDERGTFTFLSGACLDVLGYAPEELLGTRALDLNYGPEAESFLDAVRTGVENEEPFFVAAHRVRHRNGSWVWVEATGVPYRRDDGRMRVLGVARDITTRRELESQVRESQKLESLGLLAGGLAHDFNNLLTPIIGLSGMLLGDVPEDSPLRRKFEAIRQAARRAAALTDQMLSHAGQAPLNTTAVNVSQVVSDMSLLLESTASQSALELILHEDLPPVRADAGQVGQVVMNLVANAADALGPDGGRIEVRTGMIEADRALLDGCSLGADREPGPYVTLEVRDNGVGIDETTRERILDPFFTTKPSGRGLGLAVVIGIIRGHAGALQIESEEGATCFRVFLPAAGVRVGDARGGKPDTGASPDPSADAAILVVDDDPGAREVLTLVLERAGFTVEGAADGVSALERYEARPGGFDGVVLDSTMPGMSGASVFRALRALDPAARVLLVSGYDRERVANELLESGLYGFVRKPFDPEDLLRAVRALVE